MKISVLLVLAMLPVVAVAQTTPAADPAPARPPVAPSPLTTYGFVDAYYGYDFDHANGNDRPPFLFSHGRQNEFAVNQGLLGVRYDDGQVRGAVGLHAGTYASANYAAEDPVLRHVYEAYAGFRPFAKA